MGRIVAANDSAATLLARSKDALEGAPFGVWAPLLDQMDLDVVQTVGGRTRAIVVRAKRIVPALDDPYVPVLLCELPAPEATTLTQAVGLAIVNANNALHGAFRRFTVGRLPRVRVSHDIQSATEELIDFLVKLAGSLEPQLEVTTVGQGTDWVELAFYLDMQGEANVLRWKDDLDRLELPFLGVDGQACRLTFDYPHLCAVVRMPVFQGE
ncbi:MAG: hypothetical protein JNK48_01895 [Bryobacterales bacterium]|nr:hypothetical protein [Bryobacterales bacterium]